jgi:transposase
VPAFRVEAAQLLVDQNYSIREAADAMNVGKSSMDKRVRQHKHERERKPGGGSSIIPEQLRIKELRKRSKRVEEEKGILKKLL